VSPRVALVVCALASLLALVAAADPAPQADVQAGIDRTVEAIVTAGRGDTEGEIAGMAEQLHRLTEGDREALLQQLVLYLASHPGNEPAMASALLIDYYGFTAEETVAALAPHAGAQDERLRDAVWELLGTVDRPLGAPDSASRVQQLERRLLHGEQRGGIDLEDARREVAELSRDELWWVRLYAARAVRERPELASSSVLERLRSDADPRVRQVSGG